MEGWLVIWSVAGRNRLDKVVTLLPDFYNDDEVIVVLRTLFLVANFPLSEMLSHLNGGEVAPVVDCSRDPNGYGRFYISFESYTMNAHKVRNVRVRDTGGGLECIEWEEPDVRAEWHARSFTRTETGHITFDIAPT
jgi:hypothetical protein